MTTKTVIVQQGFTVTVDESKFTEEFMENFRHHFFDLDDIDDHIKFIAESAAKGIIRSERDFLEGYGILSKFGVKIEPCGFEAEFE